MIASVNGRVAALDPGAAVVEVGGVGLTVQVTPRTSASLRVGEQARLATSLVVREDSLTLYGFSREDERAVFELLQTASGVGPRLAQAMLAVHSPDALRQAVAGGDVAALTQVPGIGRKGAQRLLLELKDKLGTPGVAVAGGDGGVLPADLGGAWRNQLREALEGLGWSAKEAEGAVTAVAPAADAAAADGGRPDVAVLLRTALKTLDRA